MCGVCIFSLCFPCCNPLLCFLSTCRCIVAVDLLPQRTLVLPPTLGAIVIAVPLAKAPPGVLALLWTLIVHKRVLNSQRKRLSSSPAPDYGATDLQMRDPQFRRQTMGGAAPPAASNKSPSKGAIGGKLTPVDLSFAGRKTSSKSSLSKSSKICPYCTDSPGENLHRHTYGVHVPWYMDPTRVCWTCLQSFKQPSMLEAQRVQCAEGSFQRHAATWVPRITTFFHTVAQELSLPSMEDLVLFVTQNYQMLPQSHALDPQDQEVMKLFELNRGTYPSQRRIYQANPPKCLAELIQWRIIGGLLSLVSPQACINLMETPSGVQVTSQEDAPPTTISAMSSSTATTSYWPSAIH